MADTIKMAVFKSVTSTTLTASMLAVSMVRLGMMAYPEPVQFEVNFTPKQGAPTSSETERVFSKIVSGGAERRIVLGQNSIKDLGSSN